jgi:hypothetical protein
MGSIRFAPLADPMIGWKPRRGNAAAGSGAGLGRLEVLRDPRSP